VIKRTLGSKVRWAIWIPVLTTIITATSSLISVYMQQYMTHQEYMKTDVIVKSAQEDEKLNTLLRSILDYYKCDRVVLFQIHNGLTFYNSGKSFQRTSVTNEVTSSGTSPVIQKYQSIPISVFSDFITDISSVGRTLMVPDVNNEKRVAVKGILESTGVKSEYSVGIWTEDNKLIGALSLDFVKERKDLSKEDLMYLVDKAKMVSLFLMKE
jgi:cell division protein FtsL